MKRKITLTFDQSVIEKAKRYAKEKYLSLSDIIENHLKTIVREFPDLDQEDEIAPIVKSLKGSFPAPENFNYKNELTKVLSEKYL